MNLFVYEAKRMKINVSYFDLRNLFGSYSSYAYVLGCNRLRIFYSSYMNTLRAQAKLFSNGFHSQNRVPVSLDQNTSKITPLPDFLKSLSSWLNFSSRAIC